MLVQIIAYGTGILVAHCLLPSKHGIRKSLIAMCVAVVLGVMVS